MPYKMSLDEIIFLSFIKYLFIFVLLTITGYQFNFFISLFIYLLFIIYYLLLFFLFLYLLFIIYYLLLFIIFFFIYLIFILFYLYLFIFFFN